LPRTHGLGKSKGSEMRGGHKSGDTGRKKESHSCATFVGQTTQSKQAKPTDQVVLAKKKKNEKKKKKKAQKKLEEGPGFVKGGLP